jgi:hypothetical protein
LIQLFLCKRSKTFDNILGGGRLKDCNAVFFLCASVFCPKGWAEKFRGNGWAGRRENIRKESCSSLCSPLERHRKIVQERKYRKEPGSAVAEYLAIRFQTS